MRKAKKFGKQLTLLRESTGLTKKKFAECLGVSTRVLIRLESGEQLPYKPIDIYASSERLGITVKELSKWLCF